MRTETLDCLVAERAHEETSKRHRTTLRLLPVLLTHTACTCWMWRRLEWGRRGHWRRWRHWRHWRHWTRADRPTLRDRFAVV